MEEKVKRRIFIGWSAPWIISSWNSRGLKNVSKTSKSSSLAFPFSRGLGTKIFNRFKAISYNSSLRAIWGYFYLDL